MNKQLRLRDGKIKTAYWSLVGVVAALLVSTQAVFAADMWDRFSMIMKDIYGELVAISTIVAVTVAAIALLVRMISRNQRAVDEATSWLKRIVITWIVLNSLGFIVAYLQPLTPEQSGQQLKRMRSYPIRFLLKLDLRPRDGFPFVFRHCCRRKHPAQWTISGLIFIRLCGSSLRVSLRSAFGIACLPTVMCTIEAARNGPCVITIISKPIWSRIFWRCMFCPTITRQFARITIAALPEARTARKSM